MVYNTYLPLFMVILGIVSGIVLPTLLKSRTRDSQSDFLHPAIIISLVTIFLFFWLVPRYKKKVLEALKNDQKCMIWRIVLPALRIIQIPQVFSSAGFFLCHSRASEIIVFAPGISTGQVLLLSSAHGADLYLAVSKGTVVRAGC